MGLFEKLKQGLKKTRDGIGDSIERTLTSFGKVDDELFEQLEETLIMADVGVETSAQIILGLKKRVVDNKVIDPKEIREHLKQELAQKLNVRSDSLYQIDTAPKIIMIIGVNGAGKTTTIGKMSKTFRDSGKSVVVAAADTFRAAAIDQLEVWCKRSDATLIRHGQGADPAAVIYDAIRATLAKKADVLICDTAGRLHNKKNLMDELSKMFRVIGRELPNAQLEVLLVLDATTGQNAVSQAKSFSEISEVTGIVLTKLDGTAKGGIVVTICNELKIPVKLIGIGEGIDDLQEFDALTFAQAMID
ncbi:MAG: signal recognition particle-docking protein FtsY [Bacillota bacterium]